jgi:CheY-like chemotaxis protein
MDAETQKHIFEPFYTTKKQGKGIGLGLATVFGIVKQHQGHIWVYSEPGKGTTFKVYLPQSEDAAQPTGVAEVEPVSECGTETILVVEDEELVRKLVCETLTTQGYRVIEASSPADALKLAADCQETLHLLLTDVIMPTMNGPQLHQKLTAIYPGLKVLFMSGYTNNVIVHHGILDEGVNFLQKPFTIQSLSQKVRKVLNYQL